MGFLGAVAAIALKVWGLPVWLVIPGVLLFGMVLGALPAFMVANLGIPAFVATLAGWPTPLTAIQILWLNLVTDGAPALALGTEKGDPDIMDHPPRPPRDGVAAVRRRRLPGQ